jgi:beta-glucosidase
VTLLENDKGRLPFSRHIAKIAIVGPHADDVAVGFPTCTYPDGMKMMHARATGGDIAMAGIDLGGSAPPEAKAAAAAELGSVFKGAPDPGTRVLQ